MMNLDLKQGQQSFTGVLIEFSDVKGKSKKDNKEFHFAKINVDLSLVNKDGEQYSKLCEFIADPSILLGVNLQKYATVVLVFEIINPMVCPKLVKIYSSN